MPRLQPGQVALGVATKSAKIQASIAARIDHLRGGNPDRLPARRTLQGLSEWNEPSLGITPVSVNSLRKYARERLAGGVHELVSLCSGDRPATTKAVADKGATQTEALADAIMSFALRYGDLMDRVRRLAVSDESVKRELDAHRGRFGWVHGKSVRPEA